VTESGVTEFASSSENLALKEAVIERIQGDGPITFQDFMAMALYEPGLGYYCSPGEKIGRAGDYLTSPEVSPLFGVMIGRQLREMWHLLGRPGTFDIVEPGAGNGTLCRDVLSWPGRTAPDFLDCLRYILIDSSEAMTRRQQELLESERLAERVRWEACLPQAITGCILSNELLDAMPVHRVSARDEGMLELFVGWDGRRFVEEFRPPSTPALEDYFSRLGIDPPARCLTEVNLDAECWMGEAAARLSSGFLITFDYGYEAAELYAPWRTEGTLLTFYHHNPGSDPYLRLGRQDMTAHVDFTTVGRAGEQAGLATLGLVSQSQFLSNLGISEALRLGESDRNLEEYHRRKRAVLELLDPAGLGRIKALVQTRGQPQAVLTGWAEGVTDA